MQRNRKNLLATGALAALAASAVLVHPGHAQDAPLTAEFAEVYRAGGLDVPEWAQFSGPGHLGFDGSGNLHVLDNAAYRVVVIGPDGQLVRTVGRQGEGPGEFRAPTSLVVWRDGTFAVEDNGHFAFQVFDPDGTLARFVRMSQDGNPLAAIQSIGRILYPPRPDPRGGALFRQGPQSTMGRMVDALGELLGGTETEETPVDDRGIERVELVGEAIAVQPVLRGWRAPREEAPAEISANDVLNQRVDFLGMYLSESMWFEPELHWDVLPDGTIAYSDSSAYAVKLLATDGSVNGVLRRPHEPEPVGRRLRARVIEEEMNEGPDSDEEDPDLGEAYREALEDREFYPEVPVILGIHATWDGSLWIHRQGEDPLDDAGPIDVFGTDRRYLGTFAAGTIEVPFAFGPDGLVAFWELDELDIPIAVVKRLPDELR